MRATLGATGVILNFQDVINRKRQIIILLLLPKTFCDARFKVF